MKKSKVVLFNIILFIILFPIFDIIASNFFLKIDDAACHKIERYYYELKKNCIGNYKFKPSFPTVKVYTDEQSLRTAKKRKYKDTNNNATILLVGDGGNINIDGTLSADTISEKTSSSGVTIESDLSLIGTAILA